MSRNFELEWNDLSYEKQQEMIESIKNDWIEALKQEGLQEILNQKTNRWRNWQKEHTATDDQLVLIAINELYDFEPIDEDTEYNELFYKSLGYSLEDMAEKKAQEACWAGVHNMEIEVQTP